jgi:CheY-like chemotaxis protein
MDEQQQHEKLKILYVDDSSAQLDAVKARLTEEGHTVALASDSVSATRLLQGKDIVIIDFHMPGLDGAQLLALLKPLVPPGDRVSFYLYTSDPAHALAFRKYGFDGAFTRKGSLDDLVVQVHTVGRLLHMRRFMRSKMP